MPIRAALLLCLALSGGGQASEDWLSVKEWWVTTALTFTNSGRHQSKNNRSEWSETETVSLEGVLGQRSAAPMIFRKGTPLAAMTVTRAGRWQAWIPRPGKDPGTYIVSGESNSSGHEESPGEGGFPLIDRGNSQKSRIGSGSPILNLSRVQIDREKNTYAFAVPLLQAVGDPAIQSLDTGWHEHVQPSGYRESDSFTGRSSTRVVPHQLGAHPSLEVQPGEVLMFDLPLPDKVGALQGSVEIPLAGKQEGGQARKAVLTWTFSPTPPPPIEMEIEVTGTSAGGWADWRPRGTTAVNMHGAHIDITARVVSRGGPLPDKPVKIALRLSDVSSEPGVCVNFPDLGDDPPSGRADLRFVPNGNGAVKVTDLSARTIDPPQPEIQARLASFDFGAWGEVMAEARLESGRMIFGHLKGKPGERKLLVPDRDKDSKIARAWKSPGKDKEDLDDQPPGDGQPGDGFSNYEEYRGFYVRKVWKDGDPAKKEFFVRNEAPVLAAGGVDLFEKITKLRVHRIDAGEMRAGDRVVNFNKGYAHAVDQHGVRIFYDPNLSNSCWAEADGRPGRPRDIAGGVHVGTFKNRVIDTMDGTTAVQRPYADPSVAHELLHCCNVYHHGDPGGEGERVWIRDPAGELFEGRIPIKVFDEAGNDISSKLTSGNSLDVPLTIRKKGGLASGNISCVMRYDESQAYILPGLQNHRVRIGPGDPPEPIGGSLCTSPDATGTNATPGRFGAATRGNCAGQIVVNDAARRTDRSK